MSTLPTLPTGPFEHPAQDYAFLRQEGIRHLERLAGHIWTDFNAHDPGITILEQLCYAITDLAYRASYDVPDLLASGGADPYQSLYSPATILTSHPVTLLDLRKVILDVEGVKNAWIEVVDEPLIPLYYHERRSELGFQPEPPYTAKVLLKGLHRVLIERSELHDMDAVKVRQEVARRLHGCRPLCTDFEEIQVLDSQSIQVHAEVEVGPVDDAETVLLQIYEALSEHVSPSVPFATLGQILAAGKRSDEIFDGPPMEHGFLDSDALERMARKDAIYTSDLIRVMMDIPGVRAVRSIVVSADDKRDAWRLPLDARRAPRLDLRGSSIILMKERLTARLDVPRIIEAFTDRRKQVASHGKLTASARDLPAPVGRDRKIGRYHSIQHDLPAVYGIGGAGLPDSATPKRKAQAKRLQAYLLFFDQLLADYFAQLAHAGSLFSFYQDAPRTYFAQMVDDPNLGLEDVRIRDPGGHRLRLEQIAGDEAQSGSLSNRKNRFLNHLMARFAEQFTDYSLVLFEAASRAQRSADDKRTFLQHYPRISSARGTGLNAVLPGSADNESGLEERILRKLGLVATDEERFFLVEHLLLRPIDEDNIPPGEREYEQIPMLSASHSKDPYSLQVSFVFRGSAGRLKLQAQDAPNELRLLVEQTIREETPAHLIAYIHWLDEDQWKVFEPAHTDWLDTHRSYRAGKLGVQPMSDAKHFYARDARDRLIDLLGFGETYPLRDLPVRDEQLTVPFNQPARIPIDYSQRGVTYELRSDSDDTLIVREEDGKSVPVRAEGNGGTLELLTPPIKDDTTYNILARKLATGREAYLQQQATVKVGLDLTLPAHILDATPLDPSIETPADQDPRIVAYGTAVNVQIDRSQEGVDYHLVHFADGQEKVLSQDVRGKLVGPIILFAAPAYEDLDLRIRATKVFDPSENRATQTALLNMVLPLKVRARLDIAVSLESTPVAFGTGAVVRIENTQASASYRLYVRAVSDSEFVFPAESPSPELLTADVEGEPSVYVQRPPEHPIWEAIEGFEPLGAPAQGHGATLSLPASGLTQDSVILVRAQKEHQAKVNIPSSVQLKQAALVLVRPDPAPALKLAIVMDGAKTTGTLLVTGGQPGVFYHVRTEPDGADLGWPAYFHKTDERDAALNKGLEQLRIGVDVAISRGTMQPATTSAELASTRPLTPLLDTGPLDAGTTLHFRAVKAQTRVAAPLLHTAQIAPIPEILAEPAAVPKGSPATIVVRASVVGDRYALAQNEQPIGQARDGDGGDLTFTTGPLQENAQFEVLVTRPGEPGIPVERRVDISVTVTPGG